MRQEAYFTKVADDGAIYVETQDGGDMVYCAINDYIRHRAGEGSSIESSCSDIERLYFAKACGLLARTFDRDSDHKVMFLERSAYLQSTGVFQWEQFCSQAIQELVVYHMDRNNLSEVTEIVSQVLSADTNAYNFVYQRLMVSFLADTYVKSQQHNAAIELLRTTLTRFQGVPKSQRVLWEFYNDPIMDVYEDLIYNHSFPSDAKEMTRLLNEYLAYFKETYEEDRPGVIPLHTYRYYLGWGLGKGLPTGRFRVYVEFQTLEQEWPDSFTLIHLNDEHASNLQNPGFEVQLL
jgi:hypothetical protein